MKKTTITARMRSDGTVVEVLRDGSERPFPDTPMRPMTPEEIEEAARNDPDAQPLTEADFQRMRRVPRVKTLRRALGLTQEEFAARYHIPLGTLRDWEQGRSEPDQPGRAYLHVIAHDPEGVRRLLENRNIDLQESAGLINRWRALSNALGQLGYDILGGAKVAKTKKNFADPRVLSILLMARTLSNFKGAVILLDNEMIVESRIMVRSCFENMFWMAGLLAEGDEFVKLMRQDSERRRKMRGELLLSVGLPEPIRSRLRAQLRAIGERSADAKSLDAKKVAFRGLLRDGYHIYAQLSDDSAHPSLTSLIRYRGGPASDGEIVLEVVPRVTEEEIIKTWDWACNAMIGACTALNQILGGTAAAQRLYGIADQYQALTASTTVSDTR